MKKILLAGVATALLTGAASAADLPRRAAPPVFVAPPVFTWTGVYIGTHTAYNFSSNQRVTTTGTSPAAQAVIDAGVVPGSVRTKSYDDFANFGGGFGVNYQFTPGSGFVVGAAVDADWTDLHKSTFVLGAPLSNLDPALPAIRLGNGYQQNLDWFATANGRIGYAWDRFLVYGTGGAAIGHVRYGHTVFFGNTILASGGDGANEVGYNYGGGIEYAIPQDSFLNYFSVLKLLGVGFGGNVTLKAEYIHYDLGSRNVAVTAGAGLGGALANSRFKTDGDMIRAGFSYKFP